MNQKTRVATYTRGEIEDGVFEKQLMELDEREINWIVEHRGEVEDYGCELSMQMLPPARDAWAKLVDDAVGVWEGERRRCVEELGWEVCSDVGTRARACSPSGLLESELGGKDEDEDEDWDKVSICTV